MSTLHTPGAGFQPAFCHRNDCKANPQSPFCAACGADIVAYLAATTAAPPMPRRQIGAYEVRVRQPQPGTPPQQSPAVYAQPGAPEAAAWRQPIVLGAFGAATLVGALAAIAGNLV